MDPPPPSNTNAQPGISDDVNPHQRQPHTNSMVESILFNSSLKLAALRITLLTSATVLGSIVALFLAFKDILDHKPSVVYMAITPFILIHHCISAFKIRFMSRIFDLLLLIGEIALLIIFKNPVIPDRFDPTSFIVLFVASWCLVAVLLFLLTCRIAAIVRHRGTNLFTPFDFLEDAVRWKGIPIEGFPAAYSMLIGRSIWRTQFVGEGLAVRLLRGLMAGGFITALIGYGMLSLVIKPVQETALTPVKESRGVGIPFDQIKTIELPTWNFGFLRAIFTGMNETDLDSPEIFHAAVNVSVLSDGVSMIPCKHSPGGLFPDSEKFGFQIIHVQCPSNPDNSSSVPDALIEVDYEPLWLMTNPLRSVQTSAVFIFVGFTNNTDFLTNKTMPIALPVNAHYLAGVDANFRKVLKRPALSALGMFEATNTFIAAKVLDIVPDPLASFTPPAFNTSGNFSTFRFFINPAPEIVVIEDWRERSVLGGFSALGGLWTFLGGIFVMLFGTSLMRIFFNSRPLSIFGLAQRMEKDTIAKEYLQQYPKIEEDLNLHPSQRGIMALLQDHMIDVALFEEAISEKVQNAKAQTVRLDDIQVDKARSSTGTPDIQEVNSPALTYNAKQ